MKSTIYHFFIWLAGSDTNILKLCPQAEHKKHAGFGALLLIPTVMAFISGSFALSIFTDDPRIYFGLAAIWSGVILAIDRFIISTVRKSGSVAKDIFSWSFFSRLIIASGFGLMVSHPATLSAFGDDIDKKLVELGIAEQEGVTKKYGIVKDGIQQSQDQIAQDIAAQIEAKEIKLNCAEILLRYEQTGQLVSIEGCGSSSGEKGNGKFTEERRAEINQLRGEIAELRRQDTLRVDALDSLLAEQDTLAAIEIRTLKANDSKSYIARANALTLLAADSDFVKWAYRFLIVFLLLLDIIPVILKATSKYGPYDRTLGTEDAKVFEFTFYEDYRKLHKGLHGVFGNAIKDIEGRLDKELADEVGRIFTGWLSKQNRNIKELLKSVREFMSALDVDYAVDKMVNPKRTFKAFFTHNALNILMVLVTLSCCATLLYMFDYTVAVPVSCLVLGIMGVFKDRKSIPLIRLIQKI